MGEHPKVKQRDGWFVQVRSNEIHNSSRCPQLRRLAATSWKFSNSLGGRASQQCAGGLDKILVLVVVSNIFYFHPYLGKSPILTNIFQRGWNHQLVVYSELLDASCKYLRYGSTVWSSETIPSQKENLRCAGEFSSPCGGFARLTCLECIVHLLPYQKQGTDCLNSLQMCWLIKISLGSL